MMDVCETRVISRKKNLIAKVLGFSSLDQKKYRNKGLLDDTMLETIIVEPSEIGQAVTWLNLLCQHSHVEAFVPIQKLLEDSGYGWIADELKIDLLAEKGDLKIEDSTEREAGKTIHHHFGQSKRISESDKRTMREALALRYQSAKTAWQRHHLSCKEKRADVQTQQTFEDSRMKTVADKVSTYLRMQQNRLDNYSKDVDPLSQSYDGTQNYYEIMGRYEDNLFQIFSRVLQQKERLEDERRRCLSRLRIQQPVEHFGQAFEEAVAESCKKEYRDEQGSIWTDCKLKSTNPSVGNHQSEELIKKKRHVARLEAVIRQREARIQKLEETRAKPQAK